MQRLNKDQITQKLQKSKIHAVESNELDSILYIKEFTVSERYDYLNDTQKYSKSDGTFDIKAAYDGAIELLERLWVDENGNQMFCKEELLNLGASQEKVLTEVLELVKDVNYLTTKAMDQAEKK